MHPSGPGHLRRRSARQAAEKGAITGAACGSRRIISRETGTGRFAWPLVVYYLIPKHTSGIMRTLGCGCAPVCGVCASVCVCVTVSACASVRVCAYARVLVRMCLRVRVCMRVRFGYSYCCAGARRCRDRPP
jgi:hypothetical protein